MQQGSRVTEKAARGLAVVMRRLVVVALHVLNWKVARFEIAFHFGRQNRQSGANCRLGVTATFCPYTSCKGEDGRRDRDEDNFHHLNLQRGIPDVGLLNPDPV